MRKQAGVCLRVAAVRRLTRYGSRDKLRRVVHLIQRQKVGFVFKTFAAVLVRVQVAWAFLLP